MIKNSYKQNGSVHVVIIIILVAAIVGALGYVVWKNFISTNTTPEAQTTQTEDTGCKPGIETNGVFCSDDLGVTFQIPVVLQGKIKSSNNYEVFKGTVDYDTRTSAGTSNAVYSAEITGSDEFTLIISKEPLRSGYVDVGHGLAGTYYDADTGLLSSVTTPTQAYDSATDTTTKLGDYAVGETVPSFMVGNVKVYHGSVGDAGTRIETYFAVINGSIVKIKLTHGAFMGPSENDPATIDADVVFAELDSAVKTMKLIR